LSKRWEGIDQAGIVVGAGGDGKGIMVSRRPNHSRAVRLRNKKTLAAVGGVGGMLSVWAAP